MPSYSNKNTKYYNLIIHILVILLFLGLFKLIIDTINLFSVTNQNNITYVAKTTTCVDKLNKFIFNAEENLDIFWDEVIYKYQVKEINNPKYNNAFINKLQSSIILVLNNTSSAHSAWFISSSNLTHNQASFYVEGVKNGKYIYFNHKLSDRNKLEIYKHTIKINKVDWSNVYKVTNDNKKIITVSRPVYRNGKLVGVVGIDFYTYNFDKVIFTLHNAFNHSDIYLLNNSGNLLLHKYNDTKAKGIELKTILNMVNVNSKSQNIIQGYIQVNNDTTALILTTTNDFYIIVIVPKESVINSFSNLYQMFLMIVLLTIVLSIFAVLNIKEIRSINKEIKNKANQLDTIFSYSPNLIMVKNTKGQYLSCNSKFSEIFNISSSSIVGKTAYDLFTPEEADVVTMMEKIVIKTKKLQSYETTYNTIEGELIFKKYVIPLLNLKNNLEELLIIAIDVTKNRTEQKILKNAKDAAEKAAQMKSNFLANMSHEIRTPLNGVLGFIQLLKETNLSYEQEEFVVDAQKASESLLGVINDILDFSKMEAGKLQVENISFDLRALVEDITLIATANAENRGLDVNSLICSDVPKRIFGDPGRIRQILNNLISNAIKFTHEGEVIIYIKQILEDEETSFITFEVKDTGIGIDNEQLGYIFEEFAQADPSMTRKYGGTGLGLAICHRLVTLMNGTIHVKSKLNEGSTFTFTLPLKKDLKYEEPPKTDKISIEGVNLLVIDASQTDYDIIKYYLSDENCTVHHAQTFQDAIAKITSENLKIDVVIIDYKMQIQADKELSQISDLSSYFNDIPILLCTSIAKRGDSIWAKEKGFRGYLTKPIKQKDLHDAISLIVNDNSSLNEKRFVTRHLVNETKFCEKTKILVVEDSELNCKLIKKILETHGLYCDFAYNGKEAVDAYKTKVYDLILMDCQMPVLDGYAATEQIRALETDNNRIPIIALTANAMPNERNKCLNSGMDDYICKPLDISVLMQMIKIHLNIVNDAPVNNKNSISRDESDDINKMIDKLSEELMFSKRESLNLFIDYFQSVPSILNDLEHAITNENIEDVYAIAHKLKGISLNLRIEDLGNLAKDLENAAKNNMSKNVFLSIYYSIAQHFIYLDELFKAYTSNFNNVNK